MLNENVECPECGTVVGKDDKFCKECGTKLPLTELGEYTEENLEENIEPENEEGPSTQRKYSALKTIATVYKVIANIWLIGSIISGIIGIGVIAENIRYSSGARNLAIFLNIVVAIVIGVVGFISFLAASENIKLFIDIEENTRLTNNLLRKFINNSNS